MDDRRAHFLTMLGDACAAASLAGISVELGLGDGRRVIGTPSAQPAGSIREAPQDIGYSSTLLIDGAATRLDEVVEFSVHTP